MATVQDSFHSGSRHGFPSPSGGAKPVEGIQPSRHTTARKHVESRRLTNEAGRFNESQVPLEQRDQLWLERGIRVGRWLNALVEHFQWGK